MPNRIRRNDQVVVISGKDKGKRGRVMKVLSDKDKVIVEGVNVCVRHKRRNQQNPAQGGRVSKEAPIPMCKVMPWSDKDGRGVRVQSRVDEQGRRIRVAAKSGTTLASAEGTVTAKTKGPAAEAKK